MGHVRGWFRYALCRSLDAGGVGGDLVTDADITVLTIEYQAQVHSNDVDFARFPGPQRAQPL